MRKIVMLFFIGLFICSIGFADTYKVSNGRLRITKPVSEPEEIDISLDRLYREKEQIEAALVKVNDLIEVAENLGLKKNK